MRKTNNKNKFGKKSGGEQFNKKQNDSKKEYKPSFKYKKKFRSKPNYKPQNEPLAVSDGIKEDTTRLNKYLSNAGICSRREADDLIKSGVVSVNGKTITEMGFKVKPDDIVKYAGETVKPEKLRYVLLNKPKDFITTTDDPDGRKHVMELIKSACSERVYPVGRLDRMTTGVLLFTNDGELAKRLTHPKYGIKKIYHIVLDQNLKRTDFELLESGIELEDGFIKPDSISYVADGGKNEIGIEIHSGRNRIIRRMFEHLGYRVSKLDRVLFAGLTKKDIPRGKYRHLKLEEVAMLKMLSGIR